MHDNTANVPVSNRLTRRSLLKGTLATSALAATQGIAACSSGSSTSSNEGLNLLTWQGYHDHSWLKQFSKKTGIRINASNVGSPAEMFSKVKAAPEQYDIVLPTSGWFERYTKGQLLTPLEPDRLTGLKEIKLGFDWKKPTTIDGQLYGVLYNWGTQPLAWIDGTLPNDSSIEPYLDENGVPNDWNILWDPAFKDKVSIFDDPTSVMPMIPLALGMNDPFHLTGAQLTKVQKKLMALRPQVPRLTSGYDDQTQQFASGEATIGYLNIATVQVDLAKIGRKLIVNNTVKQGVPSWSDNYAITVGGAKKKDTVYAFINETLKVPWQARFIATSGNNGTLDFGQGTSSKAISAGLTKKQLDSTLIPATEQGDKLWSRLVFFQAVEDLSRRLDMWNKFKLGVS